jgi:predicted signal transduction protein with EAL and GGDEF domain
LTHLDDAHTRAIVELIVNLGAALGLNIVAEGVETQEQSDALVQIGCGAIQGYYFGRPVSGNDVDKIVEGLSIAAKQCSPAYSGSAQHRLNRVRLPPPCELSLSHQHRGRF